MEAATDETVATVTQLDGEHKTVHEAEILSATESQTDETGVMRPVKILTKHQASKAREKTLVAATPTIFSFFKKTLPSDCSRNNIRSL